MQYQQFTAEQDRARANLAEYYAQWLDLERARARAPHHLAWKEVSGAHYLYETPAAGAPPRSLGRESPLLVSHYDSYLATRRAREDDMAALAAVIAEAARVYAALNLPRIDSAAAEVFRACDREGMMGTQLLVIGTNAMAAYEMEAGGRIFQGLDATADCDLAFRGDVVTFTVAGAREFPRTLFGTLKSIDPTYTVNTERSFQARNRRAFEVELLAAPSVIGRLPPGELSPLDDLAEQEWLLLGNPVSAVVLGLDRKPARMVVPDPRWMALHKAWLAGQGKRRADKRRKDGEQARRLMDAVRAHMPAFPLDAAFRRSLPAALKPLLAALS